MSAGSLGSLQRQSRWGTFRHGGKEAVLTRDTRQKVSPVSIPLGPGFLFSSSPGFCPGLLPTIRYSAGWRLQPLSTLFPREPLSLDAQEIGGKRTRLQGPTPPTALSPPAGSTCNDREWPPGGQAGSATQGSQERGFLAETLSWLWGRGRAGLRLVLTAPLSCNIESGGARIRCPVLQIRKLRLTEIM